MKLTFAASEKIDVMQKKAAPKSFSPYLNNTIDTPSPYR